MEVVGSVVWLVGGESPDQKFVKNYLVRHGYVNRQFFSGEECLECLSLSDKGPDMIMILDDPQGQVSAARTEQQIMLIEPGMVTLHLSKMQIFALRQRAYSYDSDKQEFTKNEPVINPALKRLTDLLIKLSLQE